MTDTIMMTPSETAAWLLARDNFLILTHKRPDGDTIGCAAALCRSLRALGKTAYVLYNEEATERYLPFLEEYWAPEDLPDPEHVITVDTASYTMFPENGAKYIGAVSLCIDHHRSNTLYAQATCLDAGLAACGELVFDILSALPGSVCARVAGCLYMAVSTDTGCFAFANTTADSLRTAAALIDAGAPHRELNRMLFRSKSRARVKIEGLINSGLSFHFGDTVCIATITNAMMAETGATEDDMADIAAIPGSVEDVNAGITIRELGGTDECKVSVRTSPSISAHDICKKFGGGGHAMAAGFSLDATVSEIKEKLLDVLRGVFPDATA